MRAYGSPHRTSTNIHLKPTSLFLPSWKIGEVANTSQLHLQEFLYRNEISNLELVRLHSYSKLFKSPQGNIQCEMTSNPLIVENQRVKESLITFNCICFLFCLLFKCWTTPAEMEQMQMPADAILALFHRSHQPSSKEKAESEWKGKKGQQTPDHYKM